MFYEDVQITATHPTIDKLVWRYGHRTSDWESIWNHRKNIAATRFRATPAEMRPGDILYIPIPWRVISTPMSPHANGVEIRVNRNGGPGLNLRFVQTVNRANQRFGPPDVFCTDPCTPDDPAESNEPFYRTRAELQATPAWRAKQLYDRPSRGTPSAAAGTTRWRAVTSIACVTGRRITIFDTKVWGFNLTPAGVVTVVIADASATEIAGHLNLLRNSAGGNFRSLGWTLRLPPVDNFGDFYISDTVARTA